jgi:DNA-binding NarL/FixJ family response regulator
MGDRCKIAIVDVHPMFRVGLARVIRRNGNFAVVGEGTTADDATQIVGEKKPHVLLLEAAVPGSLAAAQAILRAHGDIKVVILASVEPIWRDLSIREQQVLDYTSKGLSNNEIAGLLGLGLSTIKYHKTLAFKKMGVRNRVEAVLTACKAVKRAEA